MARTALKYLNHLFRYSWGNLYTATEDSPQTLGPGSAVLDKKQHVGHSGLFSVHTAR